MAHYAYLDSDNVVTQVIVGKDEDESVEDSAVRRAALTEVCKKTREAIRKDAEKAVASYDNGVLTVRVPKRAGGRGHAIKVT